MEESLGYKYSAVKLLNLIHIIQINVLNHISISVLVNTNEIILT